MTELVKYAVIPAGVLFVLFLIASPFAFMIHSLLALMKRLTGKAGATVLYCLELGALYACANWYGSQVQTAIDAGLYDGPVAFGAGIGAGFVILFAGILGLLNGIGLWRLLRYRRV